MAEPAADEREFRALLEQVARVRGFPCANYKDGCLRRRIAVRMRARGAADFTAYAALLQREPAEYDALMEVLTINVTRLYRDADAWAVLAERVLPQLWDASPRFTAWSAGCASGEELYTLAALLHQHATRTATLHKLARTRVIGTDIDETSLQAAARGVYSADQCVEVPPDVRVRYFGATAPHSVAPELRALVRVQRQNLLLDAPPAMGVQLITCRNLLIYLDRASQEPIIRRFHDALAPGGVLMLGKVETLLGPARTLFTVVDQRQRIFQRDVAA